MRGARFIGREQIAFVPGGASELLTLFRAGELDLSWAEAVVVREPDLTGEPFYVVVDAEARAELLRRLGAASERPPPGWVGQILQIAPAPLVNRDSQLAGGVVLEEDAFVGVIVEGHLTAWPTMYSMNAFGRARRFLGLFERFYPRAREARDAGDLGDDGADDRAPGSDPVIRRTPHLDAPDELPTTPGSTFNVRVWTDRAPARSGEESEDIVVEAPPDLRTAELGVLLITSPHLAVNDPYFQPLTIDRETDDSATLKFAVTICESQADGPVTLIAQFLYRGRPCGRVGREWTWPAGTSVPTTTGSTGVPVHTQVTAPDLSVVITATGAGRFTCTTSVPTPSGPKVARPVEWPGLQDSAATLVSRELANLVDRSKSTKSRRQALRTSGRAFWNASPSLFRDALWDLIDARATDNPKERAAVYIASDEPLLPWEIMLPSRPRPGLPHEERPQALGVEFAVGRWVRGDATSPPQTLPVRDSFVIAASYPEADKVLDPTMERQVLEKHFAGRQLEQASYTFLEEYLDNNSASLLHFVCHGAAEGNDTAIFLDGWDPCTSAELRDNRGIAAACAARHPIVFLNACDGGRGNPTLGPGGAGFPRAFSELGARAIVAPLWPVTKSSAPLVAKEIYEKAAAAPERPLADILAELRMRSYDQEPFDDSWAAYCLFGDPRGKLRHI